jgi:hypothetical protein
MFEPTALDPEADPVLEPNSSSDATTWIPTVQSSSPHRARRHLKPHGFGLAWCDCGLRVDIVVALIAGGAADNAPGTGFRVDNQR